MLLLSGSVTFEIIMWRPGNPTIFSTPLYPLTTRINMVCSPAYL